MAENWHIRSRARACAASERPFTEGETLVTALFPDPESSGYLRKDFCVEAWEARGDDEEQPFSTWRTVYVPPVHEEKVDPMKKEDPEELLRRLVEEDEEHTENVRYILAVMLERKKLLRETDAQRTPGGILRVYEHRKTGDVFLVRDPDIPLDEVEKVQEEVILLLEHGGRRPTPDEQPIPEEEATPAAVEAPEAPAEGTEPADMDIPGSGDPQPDAAEERDDQAP
jgi:hypothetical protein